MQLLPHEIAIGILDDEFVDCGIFPDPNDAFDGKDDALAYLKLWTEEDFGYDAAKWRDWFANQSPEMLSLHCEVFSEKVEEIVRARRAARRGG